MKRFFIYLYFLSFFINLDGIENSSVAQLRLAPQETIQKLYQMMKDMHDVFEFHEIEYWVEFGTLLGAVRHRGLIPWDDDLDVSIQKKDEKKFLLLIPFLESLGYKVIGMVFGYKVYPIDGESLGEDTPWTHPSFDVFIVDRIQDKLIYRAYFRQTKNDAPIFSAYDDVYPLKKYLFGPIVVMGPNNPFVSLNAWYGTDWNAVAYKTWDHTAQQYMEKVLVPLTAQDKKPAPIYQPLVQRFKVPVLKRWHEDYPESQIKKGI